MFRLQFLDLQLELIDDWRVRLLQLLKEDCSDPLLSLKPRILNTINYVTNDLQDLGVTVVSKNLKLISLKTHYKLHTYTL